MFTGAPAWGRRAVSHPAHSRDALNVQVFDPLAPADACGPSAYWWRLPSRFQAGVMPAGAFMTMEADDELIAMQPASIAFAVAVVTPGTVPDVAAAPVAVATGVSRGLVVSTPRYRAMPAPFATALVSVHV